jgi:hypothetical protein
VRRLTLLFVRVTGFIASRHGGFLLGCLPQLRLH